MEKVRGMRSLAGQWLKPKKKRSDNEANADNSGQKNYVQQEIDHEKQTKQLEDFMSKHFEEVEKEEALEKACVPEDKEVVKQPTKRNWRLASEPNVDKDWLERLSVKSNTKQHNSSNKQYIRK